MPKSKLYKVETFTLVQAASEQEARITAGITNDYNVDESKVVEITNIKDIPGTWSITDIPYHMPDDKDMTISDILKS